MIHQLKIRAEYLEQVQLGNKNFEIRSNDRDFKVGDLVELMEIGSSNSARCLITFVTDFEQKEGYVVFGMKVLT